MKKTLFIVIALIGIFSCSAQKQGLDTISGVMNGGLRYIDLKTDSMDNLKVYRGDYIVFKLDNKEKVTFRIEELGLEELLPKSENETPYIKMKNSGIFSYTLGHIKGTLEVVEFTGSNYKELSAAEANDLINNINPFILDVRTSGEYSAGHLPNASLIPVQVLSDNLSLLEQYKNEPLFVYCQSGNRSTVAAKILIDAGFTNVYNLRYGIGDWRNRDYPIVK